MKELFVPENRVEAAKSEAEALPALSINKVRLAKILESFVQYMQGNPGYLRGVHVFEA